MSLAAVTNCCSDIQTVCDTQPILSNLQQSESETYHPKASHVAPCSWETCPPSWNRRESLKHGCNQIGKLKDPSAQGTCSTPELS